MLKDRNTSLVVFARFISQVGGTAVFFVGVWGVAAFSFRVDASALAVLMAGNAVTGIVGSIVAGVLVDRFGPKWVLFAAEVLVLPMLVGLSLARDYPTLVAFAWLFALVASPTFTAGAAFAPSLAEKPEDLTRINGWIEAAGTSGFTLGPALGAFAAKLWGIPSVFVLAIVTSAIAAVTVWFVRLAPSVRQEGHSQPLRELGDGLRLVYTTRALRYPILAGTIVWFGFGAFSALEPLFYRDVVGVGVEWIGWMNTAFSVGLVAGAWSLSRLPAKVVSTRGLTVFGALCGLGALGYVGSRQLPIIAVGAVLWGLVIGVTEPLLRTMLQLVAPERYVGRVVGAAQYHRNAGELIPLAIAPSAAIAFGVQATLIGGGLIVAVVLAAMWPIARSIDRDLAEQGVVGPKVAPGQAHVGIGEEVL
jgi:MFS transporter, DHA3 family, macrolide efflux protein